MMVSCRHLLVYMQEYEVTSLMPCFHYVFLVSCTIWGSVLVNSVHHCLPGLLVVPSLPFLVLNAYWLSKTNVLIIYKGIYLCHFKFWVLNSTTLMGFSCYMKLIFRRLRNWMFCTQLSKKEGALMFVYMTDRVPGREWTTLYWSSSGLADTLLCFRGCFPKLHKIAFLKHTLLMSGRPSGKWPFCSDIVESHGHGDSEVFLQGARRGTSKTLLDSKQDLESHPLFLLTLMVTFEYLVRMFFVSSSRPLFF